MEKSLPQFAVSRLKLFVFALVLLCCSAVLAQKSEHYNSPLYSPRYYDSNQGTSNGLPPALQKVGIEQKLGEQLPLETELKDEDGKVVKLGDFFGMLFKL